MLKIYEFNKFSLNFTDKALEEEYRDYYFDVSLKQMRIAILIGALSYILFGIADLYTQSNYLTSILILRWLIISPLFAVIIYLINFKLDIFKKLGQVIYSSLLFTVSLSLIVINYLTIPKSSIHFPGLILAFVYAISFARLRFTMSTLVTFCMLISYCLFAMITLKSQNFRAVHEIILTYMIIYTVLTISGIIFNYTIEKLYRDSFVKKKIIDQRNNELNIANATKDKFFSIIAHDLKNQVQALNMLSELLINHHNKLNDEEKIKKFKDLNQTTKNLSDLLVNLLQWAKSQSGLIEFEPAKVNLHDSIEHVIGLTRTAADLKSIKILNNTNKSNEVYADTNQLSSILRNLIINAIKYSYPEGKVRVESCIDDQFLNVSVIDTGVGINPRDIGKLFRIENKVSTIGTLGEQGTGLGLLLSKEFVEMHGGEISVESQFGAGSSFKFTLPVV
ncbi:MAG: HAMP domain-containing sensor histidine kinase [Candidatus Kapabacteria bacterium]|nr:HAMP domain-containing sensor histidine kinase [Candidatus Kapabacteria bacterium]